MRVIDRVMDEIQSVISQVKEEDLKKIMQEITKDKRFFVDGEGRSGFQAKSFAMRLMHIGYQSYVMGETTTPPLRSGDVYVAISGSGKTKNTVHNTETAKAIGAKILAVTSKPDSDLGKLANFIIFIPGKVKNDNSVSSIQLLSSLFDQSVHITLDTLCLMLSYRDHTSDEQASKNHMNIE